MQLNHRPDRVAFIDFETQSECPLETAHKYASHPTTVVLTCVVKHDGKEVRMGPYPTMDDIRYLDRLCETHTMVAHNASFDAAVWEHTLGLPPCDWFDTLPCARAAGFPGKLDDLGTALGFGGKDPVGKQLINLLCILRPRQRPPAVGAAHQLLLEYNARDVELLEKVYGAVHTYGEPDVIEVDRTINNRGIPIRRDLLNKLTTLYEENAERMGKAFAAITDDVLPTSPKQVREWMLKKGFKVDGIGKFAMRDFFSNPEEYFIGDDDESLAPALAMVKEAFEARREVVRVGRGKAEACKAGLENDDRIREQFVYWGAHTGRWSGRGLQPHNMPALSARSLDVRETDFTYDAALALATRATEDRAAKGEPKVLVADVLNAFLRRLVELPCMSVADYGAVEARGTAWIAGCDRMLQLFSNPKASVYTDMGRTIFGREISKKTDVEEYNLSKIIVLGCGYGMSGAKFEAGCRMKGVSLTAMEKRGVSARDAVRIYRETYHEIPTLWKHLGICVLQVVEGKGDRYGGRCRFTMEGPHLVCVLPSGRKLMYRDAKVELMVPMYCKLYGMEERKVPTVTYTTPRGWRGFLYGSKLCENIVQALCRDLLADTMVRAEKDKLLPFIHVHDELGCGADALEELLRIMTVPPSWAEGFPVLAEGYSGPTWSKATKGYKEMNMLNGRPV